MKCMHLNRTRVMLVVYCVCCMVESGRLGLDTALGSYPALLEAHAPSLPPTLLHTMHTIHDDDDGKEVIQ